MASSFRTFVPEQHVFQDSEATPEYMFQASITGDHLDKTWLEQARRCMEAVVRSDNADMAKFGGDTPYITSLKELLKKYDPSISYWSNSRCTGEEFANNVCANRRAYLMFFHDNVKFSGDAAKIATYTPTNFKLRDAKEKKKRRNEQALEEALGRATARENGLMGSQFRFWLSGSDYEKYRPYKEAKAGKAKNKLREKIRDVYELKS